MKAQLATLTACSSSDDDNDVSDSQMMVTDMMDTDMDEAQNDNTVSVLLDASQEVPAPVGEVTGSAEVSEGLPLW